MTTDTRKIELLAEEAHDKRMRYEMLGMMNTPSEPEARKAAAVEYALARREMIESNRALEDALNTSIDLRIEPMIDAAMERSNENT